MAPVPTPPPPGNMTVSFLFGWQDIATVVGLLVVVAAAALVVGMAWAGASGRSEWQAWLDARSSSRPDAAADPQDRSAPASP